MTDEEDKPGFGKMPNTFLDELPTLNAPAAKVAIYLCIRAQRAPLQVKAATIAEATGLGVATVRKAVVELADRGWVRSERKKYSSIVEFLLAKDDAQVTIRATIKGVACPESATHRALSDTPSTPESATYRALSEPRVLHTEHSNVLQTPETSNTTYYKTAPPPTAGEGQPRTAGLVDGEHQSQQPPATLGQGHVDNPTVSPPADASVDPPDTWTWIRAAADTGNIGPMIVWLGYGDRASGMTLAQAQAAGLTPLARCWWGGGPIGELASSITAAATTYQIAAWGWAMLSAPRMQAGLPMLKPGSHDLLDARKRKAKETILDAKAGNLVERFGPAGTITCIQVAVENADDIINRLAAANMRVNLDAGYIRHGAVVREAEAIYRQQNAEQRGPK